MIQRENRVEEELKAYLQNRNITMYRVEGKGGRGGVLDTLCITPNGDLFILEVKDGSDYSIAQQYLLKRVKNAWGVFRSAGKWVIEDFHGKEVYRMGFDYLLKILGEKNG